MTRHNCDPTTYPDEKIRAYYISGLLTSAGRGYFVKDRRNADLYLRIVSEKRGPTIDTKNEYEQESTETRLSLSLLAVGLSPYFSSSKRHDMTGQAKVETKHTQKKKN